MTPWPQARMRGASNELLSVVLPAYNEEKNIGAMYGAVRSALPEEAMEFVFVDDGSSDGTADAVRRLREEGAPVRLIRFGRNFGHQAALFAGLERAHGSAVITMDCDLQHPPDLLPCMIRAWRCSCVSRFPPPIFFRPKDCAGCATRWRHPRVLKR